MRRVFVALGLLAVLSACVVAALPLLFSSETVRTAIKTHLEELTGREVAFRGSPAVSFSPFFAIELDNLAISNSETDSESMPLLHVAKLQAKIEVLPALLGNIRFDQYRLLSPRLNLKIYRDGSSNWEFEKGLVHDAFVSVGQTENSEESIAKPAAAKLGSFEFVDGAAVYEDMVSGNKRQVTGIEGVLNWPDISGSMEITGKGIWRGENISLSTSVNQPLELTAGGESPVFFQMESTPMNVQFNGNANMISDLFLQGRFMLESPSTTRVSEFLDTKIGDFGSVSVNGNLEATAQTMRLTDASIDIANNTGEGRISLSFDEAGNSKLDGTLAFDAVNLSTLFDVQVTPEPETGIGVSAGNTKIDLRISAQALNAGFMRLSEVAAIVNSDDSGWAVDIGDASTFGGNIIAKFGERTEGSNREGFLEATATGIDSQELSALFSDHKIRFSGKSELNLDLRATNISDLIARRKVNGFFKARFEEGAIEGIDLPGLINSTAEGSEDDPGLTELGDSTSFSSATSNMFISNSIATIIESDVATEEASIRLFGRIDLRQGNLSLRAMEVGESGEQSERLFLGGTLSAPLVSLKRLQKSRISPDSDNSLASASQ